MSMLRNLFKKCLYASLTYECFVYFSIFFFATCIHLMYIKQVALQCLNT